MRCNPPSAVLAIAVLLACVSTAAAQSDKAPKNQAHYHALVRQAVDHYERGNYEESKVLFAEAHKVLPNARTLRGLGMVAFAMRDYVQAIPFLESALANQVKPLTPPLITEAQQVIARARTFIGVLRVTLDPPNAQITVNGWRVTPRPDGTLALNPGPAEVAASAPGYQATTRLVRIEPGATLEVDLRLARRMIDVSETPSNEGAPEVVASPAAPLTVASETPAAPREGSGDSIAPWIVVGVSGAVAIGGGVLLGVGLNDMSAVENAGPSTEWSDVASKYDRAPVLANTGIALIGVGVAGVAAGLVWHFLDDEEPEQLALRPIGLGFELHRRW